MLALVQSLVQSDETRKSHGLVDCPRNRGRPIVWRLGHNLRFVGRRLKR